MTHLEKAYLNKKATIPAMKSCQVIRHYIKQKYISAHMCGSGLCSGCSLPISSILEEDCKNCPYKE